MERFRFARGFSQPRCARLEDLSASLVNIRSGAHKQTRRASARVPSHTSARAPVKCELYLVSHFRLAFCVESHLNLKAGRLPCRRGPGGEKCLPLG